MKKMVHTIFLMDQVMKVFQQFHGEINEIQGEIFVSPRSKEEFYDMQNDLFHVGVPLIFAILLSNVIEIPGGRFRAVLW